MIHQNDHDRLCDLLDGRLDAAAAQALRARIDREPDLRAAWDDLVRLRDALRALPAPSVPADFARAVRVRIDAGAAAPENDGADTNPAQAPGLPRLSHGPDGPQAATPAAPGGPALLRFPFALVAATLVVGLGLGAVLLATRPDAAPVDSARRGPEGASARENAREQRLRPAEAESATRKNGVAVDGRDAREDERESEGTKVTRRMEPDTTSGVVAGGAAPVETPVAPPAPPPEPSPEPVPSGRDEAKAPAPVVADRPAFGELDKSAGKDASAPVELTFVLEADSVESGRAAVAAFLASTVTAVADAEIEETEESDRKTGGAPARETPGVTPRLKLYALRLPDAGGRGGGGGGAAAPESKKRGDVEKGAAAAPPPATDPVAPTEAPSGTPPSATPASTLETFGASIGEIPLLLTDAEARRLAVAAEPFREEWRAHKPSDTKGDGGPGFESPDRTPPPAAGDEGTRTPAKESTLPQPGAADSQPKPPSGTATPKSKALPVERAAPPAAESPPPAAPAPLPPRATVPAPTAPAPAPAAGTPAPTTPTPTPAPQPAPKPALGAPAASGPTTPVTPPAPTPPAPDAAAVPAGARKAEALGLPLPPPTVRVRILVVPTRR